MNPYSRAADFFGRSYSDQNAAAVRQEKDTERTSDDAEINPYSTNLTIGAVPPSVNEPGGEQADINDYVTDVKEDLISKAQAKRRPTNGELAYRASGGINYAVKR